MTTVLETPPTTNGNNRRTIRRNDSLTSIGTTSSNRSCDCSFFWYLASSTFFIGSGCFTILSGFGYLGDKLHAYFEVCWYLGLVFFLCGLVTGLQFYFHVRDKCLAFEFGRRHRIWLQTNRPTEQHPDVLPQWVTQLIHDQLQHLGPGEELLINLPLDGSHNPPPYEVVVIQQGSCDAPPPTYVEAMALLNHHQHQAGDEKSSSCAADGVAEKP